MPWDAKRDALREDASYLVQTSAIDSLSAFPGDDTLAAAMRLSASRHPLVRGYAYICVGMAGRSLGDEERAGLRNRLSAIRETDTLLPDYYNSDIEERILAMSKTKTVHGECFLTAMIEYEEYTEDELRPYFDKEFEERILPPVYQGKKYILDHLRKSLFLDTAQRRSHAKTKIMIHISRHRLQASL